MKKYFVFILLSVSIFYGNAQIKITGTIVESVSNEPISDAIISFNINDTILLSDQNGKFSISVDSFPIIKVTHLAYDVAYGADFIGDGSGAYAITIKMISRNTIFPAVTITSSRAGYNSPITHTNMTGTELNKNNFGEDLPMLLESTPSVVVTSDAGNGVGYTGIRIRGSDATRVNVTINGVPYNDAESQQTYWVDLPDFANSVDDIQIQRGVGSSTNGISSLGGAININTNKVMMEPFASASFATGSFNLIKATGAFGTGRINKHWFIEGRISKIKSDGFIDRSFADLSSFFLTAAYVRNNYTSALNIFSGEEHTYQSWGGVPKDSLETNRTYNPYTYENQTDNYVQTHYQWHNNFVLKDYSVLHLTLNFTDGKGYYEQLEPDQYFSDYGVEHVIIGLDTIMTSDFITQKWLDNAFYGAYLNYEKDLIPGKLDFKSGAAFYQYAGDHYGKVIWSEYASTLGNDFEWYRNDALKNDANVYAQFKLNLKDWSAYVNGDGFDLTYFSFKDHQSIDVFADLQIRSVGYQFLGVDEDAQVVEQSVQLLFFNPKIGITFLGGVDRDNHGDKKKYESLFYFSLAKSGKEPNRDDYVESSPLSRPKPETVYDAELGNKLKIKGWEIQSNLYYMYYIDQLVLNGQINDVGAYTRINVPNSCRTGVEIAWGKTFFSSFNWRANFTLSQNKINEYTEFMDDWDTGEQIAETYQNTTLAFSPSVIASNFLEYLFYLNQQTSLSFGLQSKFVGRQFIDNTASAERSLDPYFVNDLLISYTLSNSLFNELNLKFIIQNFLNHEYESNAWVYRYVYGAAESEINGYFPQAGRNFNVMCTIHF